MSVRVYKYRGPGEPPYPKEYEIVKNHVLQWVSMAVVVGCCVFILRHLRARRSRFFDAPPTLVV
jgi:hypothetical protein